ncbi:MAG: Nudix family hydrolase [Gammaproteobacteria bacterium]|nr:Nudix family hydrolase [Gammaproteobacteria bacterium]
MDSLQVAVAVIQDREGRVLLSRRAPSSHQGGLWEFPGGKLDPGETLAQALRREIREELGISVEHHSPLIRIRHDYPDRSVLLDVQRIDAYSGEPEGLEGQPLVWVKPTDMGDYPMPAADRPIVSALRLPDRLLITGNDPLDTSGFTRRMQVALAAGVNLVQLRAPGLGERRYRRLAALLLPYCRQHGARLLLNASAEVVDDLGADGVHLNRHRLMALRQRPLGPERWVSAACHNLEELRRAEAVADFALISPVLPTVSHPGRMPLGWQGFARLADAARIPVYALGGMRPEMVGEARRHGGQGIAAIGALWPGRL